MKVTRTKFGADGTETIPERINQNHHSELDPSEIRKDGNKVIIGFKDKEASSKEIAHIIHIELTKDELGLLWRKVNNKPPRAKRGSSQDDYERIIGDEEEGLFKDEIIDEIIDENETATGDQAPFTS